MPFASDAQRKHFFANNESSVEDDYQSQVYERANNAIKNREYGGHHFYETEADAVSARDDAGSYLADKGIKRAMPQTSESEKVDWAAWRGDTSRN